MKRAVFALLLALVVTLVFGILNGLVYVKYFLPPGFRAATYSTYYPLVISTLVATLICGYIGYRVPTSDTLTVKIVSAMGYASVGAFLVFNLSMLIIVNCRGE